MAVTDDQLELLEAYIEGELDEPQAVALQTRLEANAELTAALHSLQDQRQLRMHLFESLEADLPATARIAKYVNKEITRDIVWGERLRIVRYLGAAAACVVFSFFAGWVGRSQLTAPIADRSGPPIVVNAVDLKSTKPADGTSAFSSAVASTITPTVPAVPVKQSTDNSTPRFSPRDMQALTLNAPPTFDNSGLGVDQTPIVPRIGTPNLVGTHQPGGYQVALTDNAGHIVAVQHFETLEEARDFQQDVSRWQQHIQNVDAVIVKDRF